MAPFENVPNPKFVCYFSRHEGMDERILRLRDTPLLYITDSLDESELAR